MRSLAAGVALLALAAVPPAAADDLPPTGLVCNFSTVGEPSPPEEQRGAALVHAGPMVVTGLAGTAPARVTCSLQVNDDTHAGPDIATVTSVASSGVVALPPTTVPYAVDYWANLVMCTRLEVEGGATYYLDAAHDEWGTDPSVTCVTPWEDPPVLDPFGYLDALFVEHVDPVVCPVLGGDVWVAPDAGWDCPPYEAP